MITQPDSLDVIQWAGKQGHLVLLLDNFEWEKQEHSKVRHAMQVIQFTTLSPLVYALLLLPLPLLLLLFLLLLFSLLLMMNFSCLNLILPFILRHMLPLHPHSPTHPSLHFILICPPKIHTHPPHFLLILPPPLLLTLPPVPYPWCL